MEGEPRQQIYDRLPFDIREVNLRTDPLFAETTRSIIDEEVRTPLHLDKPPLFRMTLIRQPEARNVLVVVMHHIISDGWSRNLFYQELSLLYRAFQHHMPNPLKPLRIQYKDYAVWQVNRGFEREQRYWRDKLAGAPRHMNLPYDRSPGPDRHFRGARRDRVLQSETAQALRELAASRNTTVSNVTLTPFKPFLFDITGQEDLCVAISVANRSLSELENVAGLFVNILPIRTRVSEETEIVELLAQIVQTTYEALEHQNYPFNLLVRDFGRGGVSDAPPFLDVVYVYQNVVYVYQNSEDVRLDIAQQVPYTGPAPAKAPDFSFGFAKVDLCLSVTDEGRQGLRLTLEYDSDLFVDVTIDGYLQTIDDFATRVADWAHGRRQI